MANREVESRRLVAFSSARNAGGVGTNVVRRACTVALVVCVFQLPQDVLMQLLPNNAEFC